VATTASAVVRERAADEELASLAKALGHPLRVRILRLLMSRDACFCGEIVEQLPVAQATVSQHLKVLKEAGLIRGEIEGQRVCYCANAAVLERAVELLDVLAGGGSVECSRISELVLPRERVTA
jgi:ArsR family transcriptional regulator, arsenate/arsenite/antimonite-responsive transcriptional repressor